MHWFLDPIQNHYATFSGRTGREAFWMFMLFYFVIYIGLTIVLSLVGLEAAVMLFTLGVLIPSIAITTRRLHDIGKSGWWQLIGFIPLLGLIVMIIFLIRESDTGDNEYGANPHGDTGPTDIPAADPAPVASTGAPTDGDGN